MNSTLSGSARWFVTIMLVVVASLLALGAVVARYARSEVLDTDRYVSTVAPLARDPAVQDAVVDRVTDEILLHVDAEELTGDALDTLVEAGVPEVVSGLATPLAGLVDSYTRDVVSEVVTSDRFAELWTAASRLVHGQLRDVLTGEASSVFAVEDGTVHVDLGAVVAAVKERLLDLEFALAERIPDNVDLELTLFESLGVERAQRAVRLLDRTATLLPWMTLAVGAVAVMVAPDRRRGLLAVGAGISVGMVVLAQVLVVARNWYVDYGTVDDVSQAAALSIAHTVLAPLRSSLRAVLLLAATLALGALLMGPSRAAVAVRGGVMRATGVVRRRMAGERTPSPAEQWVARNKTALRVGIVAAAALIVAMWNYPTGLVVVAIVLIVLAALIIVELLGREGEPQLRR